MNDLDEIRRIKAEVEDELLALPGVTGVDVGYREVGGEKTDELAIRVYVDEKKDVAEQDRVPKQIQGVPTDVVERRFVLHSGQPARGNDENDPLDEIRRVKAEVEEELLALPGVTGVDVGYKEVGGEKTDELAIRVYVDEKKDVAEQDRVPKQIQGVPTDVSERRFVLHSDKSVRRTDTNHPSG